MSTLSSNNLTLMDIAREFGADGKALTIAEMLTESNAILEDMPFKECNSGMVNLAAVRTGLPKGTWRKLYGGVQPEKSTTKQVQDACGMLETYSEPDKALIDMAPNKATALLNEAKAFVAGLSNEMASTIFYGDKDVPEKFEGLSSRYNAHSGTNDKQVSYNVITGGGTGSDNTSVWMIAWGVNRIYGLYPKGSQAGLQQTDKGEQTVQLPDGSRYEAYRTHFKWDCGLAVQDWRYAVRICNIDVSDLADAGKASYAGADLVNLLIEAESRLPYDATNVVIYCNKRVSAALNKLAVAKNNLALSFQDFAGRKINTFWNMPIKRCNAILNTEAAVPQAD